MAEIKSFKLYPGDPAEKDLVSIEQALKVLQDAGLDQIEDVGALCDAVSTHVRPVVESEYGKMCRWARTPNKWREATGIPASVNPSKHVKLAGQSEEEITKKTDEALLQSKERSGLPVSAREQEVRAAYEKESGVERIDFGYGTANGWGSDRKPEAIQARESEVLARAEKLCKEQPELGKAFEDTREQRNAKKRKAGFWNAWFYNMSVARAELICMGDPTWKPEDGWSKFGPDAYGCGASTFFSLKNDLQAKAEGPKPLPPLEGAIRVNENWAGGPQYYGDPRNHYGGTFARIKGTCYMGSRNQWRGSPLEDRALKSWPLGSAGRTGVVSSKQRREVLSLHIGNAGCGMGAAMWERLSSEHCIDIDGLPQEDMVGSPWSMFSETAQGRMVPRAVFASDEFSVAPSSQAMRSLWSCMPHDFHLFDASASWLDYRNANVTGDSGHEGISRTVEALRRQAEKADAAKCLLVTHSMLDAFGGGFTCNVLDHCREFNFKLLWDVGQVPSPAELVEYGTYEQKLLNTLSTWRALHSGDLPWGSTPCQVIVDETAMCKVALQRGSNVSNRRSVCQVAHVLSAITSSARIAPSVTASEGSQNLLLEEVATNLVPYPRINTFVPSLTPRFSKKMVDLSEENALGSTVDAINDGLLASVNVKATKGFKYDESVRIRNDSMIVSAALYLRNYPSFAGPEVVSTFQTHQDYAYVDWNPNKITCGSHRDPTLKDEGEIVGLFNTTAVGGLLNQYRKLYNDVRGNLDGRAEYKDLDVKELEEWMDSLILDYHEISPDYAE